MVALQLATVEWLHHLPLCGTEIVSETSIWPPAGYTNAMNFRYMRGACASCAAFWVRNPLDLRLGGQTARD